MSKYTTELRYIIESGYELKALKDYPIFDENYRQVLNKYILNHFWMREIGAETVGEFDLFLGNTLNEIMPYYNGLFKMAMSEIDPLTNYKYKEVMDILVSRQMEELFRIVVQMHQQIISQNL